MPGFGERSFRLALICLEWIVWHEGMDRKASPRMREAWCPLERCTPRWPCVGLVAGSRIEGFKESASRLPPDPMSRIG